MQKTNIELKDTGYFSSLFLDYLNEEKSLKSFYTHPYKKESFEKVEISFPKEKREVLVKELRKQYSNLSLHKEVNSNIESLLQENTFTVTTGHQLSLFTGPLFFVYKILQVVRITEELNKENTGKHYVPIFWMASEDHDFEEIQNVSVSGQDYCWESKQNGAVGRFTIDQAFKEFAECLPKDLDAFKEFYLQSENLADATRALVNHLFEKYGLVILDADSKALKSLFKEQIKSEVCTKKTNELVEKASDDLRELGYKSQIFPREINLFYLQESSRSRIIYKNTNEYQVVSTGQTFTEKELLSEIDTHPEKFSPNVVLRPVYQQLILPNVGYCGGPAEIAYWLQLKSSFKFHKATFPVLVPRAYGLIITDAIHKKIDKMNLFIQDLFLKESDFERFLKESKSGIDFSFSNEKKLLDQLEESYKAKAEGAGRGAVSKVVREFKELGKTFYSIERDIKRTYEAALEEELNRAMKIKQTLFPKNSLQERSDNVFSFWMNDPLIIDKLHQHIDPFDVKFNVFID